MRTIALPAPWRTWWWSTAAIGIAAFWLTWAAGERGFMPWDQGFVFDGGYRLLRGQVPYRDFVFPFGLVPFALLAVLFRLVGVHLGAPILTAALLNVGAAWLAMRIAHWCFPQSRWLPVAAGLMTAVWFFPPMGMLYPEQTAFFFSLVALVCSLSAADASGPRPQALFSILAGLLISAALLSKQNAGAMVAPLCPLVLAAGQWPARERIAWTWAWFAAGIVLGLGTFACWLATVSHPERYWHYAVEIPAALAEERLWKKGWVGLLKAWFVGVGLKWLRPAVIGAYGAMWVSWVMLARRTAGPARQRLLVAGALCLALFHLQNLFTYTALNQSVFGMGFLGLVVTLGIGVLGQAAPSRSRYVRLGGSVLVAALLLWGIRVAFRREVHETVVGARFGPRMPVAELRHLRWGNPTRIGARQVTEAEVVDLVNFLKTQDGSLFIFPDFIVLYGLLGVVPPQPMVWFGRGVTYSLPYHPSLDQWIVNSLEDRRVDTLVLEEGVSGGLGIVEERLEDFPLLHRYLLSTYEPLTQFGMFRVYRRCR